ncbi:polysaccharide deacetylase family protein [Streptomyces sp. NPDC002004]
MQNDRTTPARRTLLRGVAALGLTAIAGCSGTDRAGAPGSPSATRTPAPGPQAVAPPKASTFRLQPITGYGTPGRTLASTPVRRRPIMDLPEQGRSITLTFDDGPNPLYTPGVLETLRSHDVRAMFFVCGEMAVENKDLVREMVGDGHVVGNHTWTHPLLTTMTRAQIRREMERTSDLIEKIIGQPPLWFRAPYGAWNRNTFELGAKLGMEPLAWTVDSDDWERPGTTRIVNNVLGGARPGVVVLQHDAGGNRSQSVAALRRYLPKLLDEGYHVVLPRRKYT